jgi:hypothetical protein
MKECLLPQYFLHRKKRRYLKTFPSEGGKPGKEKITRTSPNRRIKTNRKSKGLR